MKAAIVLFLAVGLVLVAITPTWAITCGEVDSELAPCLPYLVSGGNPVGACCNGVKKLNAITGTADKQAACNCVKRAASGHSEIKEDLALGLAKKCGVDLAVPISKSTDCAKIK